ncbi:MAG TPA: hypothetical protein VGO47_09155 [Chlamydiales bacterium]|nr:hypothetical protein [Chlamydiales bacterium]
MPLVALLQTEESKSTMQVEGSSVEIKGLSTYESVTEPKASDEVFGNEDDHQVCPHMTLSKFSYTDLT